MVLAAGPSRRFADSAGPQRPSVKQLLDFGGESLLRRATRTALTSRLDRVIVVVGCRARRIRREVEDLEVSLVENPDWAVGQSSSVRAGLAEIGHGADAALFVPCDQPLLDAATIDRLIAARQATGAPLIRPVSAGRAGAPVLFGRELFAELATIEGDEGGRQLFASHAASLEEVEIDDPLVLADVDSWDDYVELLARRPP